MSNRLTKYDFFIVFMIILSFACLIGGFFIGANYARSKAEAEFNQYIAEVSKYEKESSLLNYAHTDFVSYYHQVYLPFKEFRHLYLSQIEAGIHSGEYSNLAANASSLRKETEKIKKEIEQAQIPHTSPLLQSSQKELVRSLISFEQGLDKLSQLARDNVGQVAAFLHDSEEFAAGKRHWLKGQTQFYEALLFWESFFVTEEKPQLIDNPSQYTLNQWVHLGFHQKNELIAKLLEELETVTLYNPEDVTVYIDSLAQHHHDGNQRVAEALKFLHASNSIREGNFIEKIKDYTSVELPMILLFSN